MAIFNNFYCNRSQGSEPGKKTYFISHSLFFSLVSVDENLIAMVDDCELAQ